MVEAKPRKVTKKDWDNVEKQVNEIYESRKSSSYRKSHEAKWKEVDRQVQMEPMIRVAADGKPVDTWRSALELGELSKASEIITSDVMRIVFPDHWFSPTVRLDWPTDPKTGRQQYDEKKQKVANGLLRSLMEQQHSDFGLKARVRLSVKEALHHGSFVVKVRQESEMMVKDGDKVKTVKAPVWVPYSMWNAYPDPSPSVVGTNLFYNGSMILRDWVSLPKLKQMANGEGWIKERVEKVEADRKKGEEGKDVELIEYIGDINIERKGDDVFLPNSRVILANGTLVFYDTNELPYSNIIFAGYERQDVRDPYYTSPIIKQSPMQKWTTMNANAFSDASEMKVRPPVEYDSNDPDYVLSDGPDLTPGSKNPTRSVGKGMQALDIGQPDFALKAMQYGMQAMQEGLGVNAVRSGVANSDRQTATEVNKTAQGAEVRTIEFIGQLEQQGLKPFLYMQHDLNREHLEDYAFHNDEMHTPDFMIATRKDIQADAKFEITGSKGILGEEQRAQRSMQATAFFAQTPGFMEKLKHEDIMLNAYRDAGEKSPEAFVKVGEAGPDPKMQQMQQQMQEQMQEAQKAIAKKQQELDGIEKQLQKKGTDVALQEQKVKAESDLLNLQRQFAQYQIKTESEKATGEHEKWKTKIDNATKIKVAHIGARKELMKTHMTNSAKEAPEEDVGEDDDLSELMDLPSKTDKLSQAVEKLSENQMTLAKMLAEMQKAINKPKTVTLKRGRDGRAEGATVN